MLLYNMDCIQGIFVSSCYILGLSNMSRLHVNAYWSIIFLKIKNVKDSENIKELISWEEFVIKDPKDLYYFRKYRGMKQCYSQIPTTN